MKVDIGVVDGFYVSRSQDRLSVFVAVKRS